MGTSVSKASTAIRAFGRAFGFIGRIFTPSTISFKWRRKKTEHIPVKRTLSERDAIELEIEKIERRLDSVYRRIAQGASVVRQDKTGSDPAELDELLRLSHDLKDNLRAKRLELSRLQRQTARNVRFQISVSSKSGQDQDLELEERKEVKRNLPAKQTYISPKLARAIQNAAKKASFRDNSKKIIFESIVRDILEGDEELRRVAVSNLSDLKGSASRDLLTLLLDDPDSRVCAAALNSLSAIGEPVSASIFRRFIDSREDYLRLAALRGLARLGKRQDAVLFVNHLEDRHPAIRRAAATYIGWRKEKSGIRRLIRALYDGDESVRTAAATALGQIRDDRAVMSLMRTLGDDSESVRKATKAAIEAILNEKIEIDIELGTTDRKTQVEEIKDWWRKVRIDKQLAIQGIRDTDSITLGDRDVSNSAFSIVGEESLADDVQTRRATTAKAEADTKTSKGLPKKASEELEEPIEDATYQAMDNRSKAVSTEVLGNTVDSNITTDKPLIESVKPDVDNEYKEALMPANGAQRLVESDKIAETRQNETPPQTKRVSENDVENKQPLIEEQDAFASSTQAGAEKVNGAQTRTEIEEEKAKEEEGEEAFYQEATDQFDNLGIVAGAQETNDEVQAVKADQATEKREMGDSKIDNAAPDNAETADRASESQANPQEEGIKDFGLDDLGIKVADENQESIADSDSDESSLDQEESESGDNEEYDFLLDS